MLGARRTIRGPRRPRGDCSASGSPTSTAPRTVSLSASTSASARPSRRSSILTEIEPVQGLKDLLEYAEHGMTIQPGETKRQRLAMKMATGSGKTMAMSLCIVWSYFHALYEADSPMTTSFLVIAPNLIVFERLKADFGDGATFRRDPAGPAGVGARLRPRRAPAGRPLAGDRARRALSHEHPAAIRAFDGTRQGQDIAQSGRGDGRPARQPRCRRILRRASSSTGSPSASGSWSSTTRPTTSTTRSSSGTRRSSGCTTCCAAARPMTTARASSRSSTSPPRRSTRRAASFATWWSTIRSPRRSPTGSSRRR